MECSTGWEGAGVAQTGWAPGPGRRLRRGGAAAPAQHPAEEGEASSCVTDTTHGAGKALRASPLTLIPVSLLTPKSLPPAHSGFASFCQLARGKAAVGVTSLSFSPLDPCVLVVGVEGGSPVKCSTAAVTTALQRPGGCAPRRPPAELVPPSAPAELVFAPHAGPVYSVSCSPFHRQVADSACLRTCTLQVALGSLCA